MQAAGKRRVPTIRTRMRRIVAIPMVALIVVWLGVSGYLFSRAAFQYALANATDELLIPSALALTAVMDERAATVGYLEQPDTYQEPMEEARVEADERMETILGEFESLSPFLDERAQQRLSQFSERFADLADIRDQVDSEQADRESVLAGYTALTRAGANLYEEQSRAQPTASTAVAGLSATDMFRAVDLLSLADAQMHQAFATEELSMADQHEFTRLISGFHNRLEVVSEYLGPEPNRRWAELEGASVWDDFLRLEEAIADREMSAEVDELTGEIHHDTTMPVDEEEWRATFDAVKSELTEIGAAQASYASDLARRVANQMLLVAVGVSLGIVAGFVPALALARRTAQGITNRLHQLRDETRELSDHRLPDIVRRLGEGDRVDVSQELPELRQEPDEIGEVARSFNIAQRTAVEAAVRQAEIRHGANRVFVNVAHRGQTLVHRQLRLLDKLEREQEEPAQLSELFKLDHLATRSRRHTENLLLLAGENPGARRTTPAPLVDVLRAAISESGDYSRVERQRIAQLSLRGAVVADVIHLLAELLDNATAFSPPHTKVRVSAERVPNGVVIEVEDHGIGMKDEELARVNAFLASEARFDLLRLEDDLRLGLFVVSWLAHRHGIQVHLRSSPYGGVLAIVLLPAEIIDGDGPPALEGSGTDEPETGAPSEPVTAPPAPEPTANVDADPVLATGNHRTVTVTAEPASPPREAADPTGQRPRLPRRTPQASLAPQLKTEPAVPTSVSEPAPADRADQGTDPEGPGHSPGPGSGSDEGARLRHIRATLTAFQRGTQRGRTQHQDRWHDERTGEGE